MNTSATLYNEVTKIVPNYCLNWCHMKNLSMLMYVHLLLSAGLRKASRNLASGNCLAVIQGFQWNLIFGCLSPPEDVANTKKDKTLKGRKGPNKAWFCCKGLQQIYNSSKIKVNDAHIVFQKVKEGLEMHFNSYDSKPGSSMFPLHSLLRDRSERG